MVVIVFAGFYVGMSSGYDTTYNDSTLVAMNHYTELNTINENVTNSLSNQTPSSGGFNVLGDFLSYGWNTIRLSATSINLFYSSAREGYASMPNQSSTTNSMFMIVISIVAVIFAFILVAIITGRVGI
jgi:uncharacterized protein YqhQ